MPILRKRHSWPPLRMSKETYYKESIDADPFAYFISPAYSQDAFVDVDLSADIDPGKRARSLSPKLYDDNEMLHAAMAASSPTARLKRWIERMELLCFRRSPRMAEKPMPSPDPPKPWNWVAPESPPIRGRKDVRSGSSLRVSADDRSRPRRPRSWREPSKDIWSVPEEREELGLGILL